MLSIKLTFAAVLFCVVVGHLNAATLRVVRETAAAGDVDDKALIGDMISNFGEMVKKGNEKFLEAMQKINPSANNEQMAELKKKMEEFMGQASKNMDSWKKDSDAAMKKIMEEAEKRKGDMQNIDWNKIVEDVKNNWGKVVEGKA